MSRFTRWFTGLFTERKPAVSIRLGRIGIPDDMKTSPLPAPGIYALKGERVTCENGHPIAVFTCDVILGEMQKPEVLYFDGPTPRPIMGTPQKHCLCQRCDGQWFRGGNFHFKDGWR